MSNTSISFLVSTYKMTPYVTDMLDSILEAMQVGDELIIVDDGSPDDTALVCQEWLRKNHPKGIFLQQKNQGVCASRNRAMAQAHNEYLLFLDGDDKIIASTLREVRPILSMHTPDIVEFDFYYWEPQNTPPTSRSKAKSHIPEKLITSTEDIFCAMLQDRAWALWGRVVRRGLLLQQGADYFPTSLTIDDLPSTPRMAALAKTLYYLPKPIVKYRILANSLSKQRSAVHCMDIAVSTDFVVKYIQKETLTPRMSEAIRLWSARTFYESLRMSFVSPQRTPHLLTQIYQKSIGTIYSNRIDVTNSLRATGIKMDRKIALEIDRFSRHPGLQGWLRFLSSHIRHSR